MGDLVLGLVFIIRSAFWNAASYFQANLHKSGRLLCKRDAYLDYICINNHRLARFLLNSCI